MAGMDLTDRVAGVSLETKDLWDPDTRGLGVQIVFEAVDGYDSDEFERTGRPRNGSL